MDGLGPVNVLQRELANQTHHTATLWQQECCRNRPYQAEEARAGAEYRLQELAAAQDFVRKLRRAGIAG